MTLAELLVVTTILSLLLGSLCGIYIAMVNEFQRQQGQGDTLVALSRTFDAISADVSQAVSVDIVPHQGPRGAIIYTLPLDKDATNQYYVPKWVGGSLQYRPGPKKAFYLSDSTGSFNRNGDILWRGVVSGSFPWISITPDPTWDADAQRGRIAPVDSLDFAVDNWANTHKLSVKALASYRAMNSTTQMTRNLSVCLRNAN